MRLPLCGARASLAAVRVPVKIIVIQLICGHILEMNLMAGFFGCIMEFLASLAVVLAEPFRCAGFYCICRYYFTSDFHP